MKKILLLLTILFCVQGFAQTSKLDSLKQKFAKAATNRERFRVLYRISMNYYNRGVYDSNRLTSLQLFGIAQKEKNDTMLLTAYSHLGWTLGRTGDFSSALEYYFKALDIAETFENHSEAGRIAGLVAWEYVRIGNYANAIRFCKKAIEYDEKAKKYYLLVPAYDNMAIAYLDLKQADSALYYTQLSNSLNIKAKNKEEAGFILYQFGRAYTMLGQDDLAEVYFRKAISYSVAKKYFDATSYAAFHFAKMLIRQNRIAEAKQFALIGFNEAIKGEYKREAIDNAEVLREIYDRLHSTDSAYYYSKVTNALRDSVFSEQKNLQLQNVIFSQQLHEKEQEHQKEEAALERVNNLQYAAIALALVTFIIVFFLFSHSIMANQKLIRFLGIIALLIVFEFMNLLLHPWLSAVTHHSPILMLLAMVAVAALLIPLHHRLEHWITHRLVQKNNKIRLSAAKKVIAKLEETPV